MADVMKKRHFINFSFLFFCLASCVEPVEIDLPKSATRLVVVSNFSTDKPFQVIVTESGSLQSTPEQAYVDNAHVRIYTQGVLLETLIFEPSYGEEHIPSYISQKTLAKIGIVYEIRVEAPGYKPVSSYSFVPAPASFENSGLEPQITNPGSSTSEGYKVFLAIPDPSGVENYYHLSFFQLVDVPDDAGVFTRVFGPLRMSYPIDDPALNFLFENKGVLIDDKSFNGQRKKFIFSAWLDYNSPDRKPGSIIIELRTVSKDYYLYFLTLKRQFSKGYNPFFEPVVDFTNIANGHGIFAGFSTYRDTIQIR
jgi:hypothetical protein